MKLPGAGHFGKNLVIVLALVGAGFFAAWLRFRPYLENHGLLTDGERSFQGSRSEEVRFAVWDRPQGLVGEVNSSLDELGGTLSPDGRALVFSAGERGREADLYLAELEDGRITAVRPIETLNTAGDERAPCFAGDWLWFASDRGGGEGGLDLWRAEWAGGLFDTPEHLGGELASVFDDTDPAPVPGSDSVVFASDRAGRLTRDFDLYMARPAQGEGTGAEEWHVALLDELDSAFDERDPAFTADGRTLYFASNRDAGRGGFDLYRTARLSSAGVDSGAATSTSTPRPRTWIEPEALEGVNSPGSERTPSPSIDGFSLRFSRKDPARPAAGYDLLEAHSRELFRAPGRPVGWLELLLLAALLLLALLAWLAKRWNELEVLYKCVLVSLLAHFLLMWYLRDVYPEGGGYEVRDRGDRIRVRLVSDSSARSARNAERAGQIEAVRGDTRAQQTPSRAASAQAPASASQPAPAATQLARAEAPKAEARVQAQADVTPSTARESQAVALQDQAAPVSRYESEARQLELQARASSSPAERSESAPTLQRGSSVAVELPAASQSQRESLPRSGSEDSLEQAPERSASGLARSTAPAPEVAVATPAEEVQRRTGEAPRIEIAAQDVGGEVGQAARAPLAQLERRASSSPASGESESAPAASHLERAQAPRAEAAVQAAADLTPSPARESQEVALQDAGAAVSRYQSEARELELQAGTSASPLQRSQSSPTLSRGSSAAVTLPTTAQARREALRRSGSESDLERAPERSESAPERSAGPSPQVAVAAPADEIERRVGEAPRIEIAPLEVGGEVGEVTRTPLAELQRRAPSGARDAGGESRERPAKSEFALAEEAPGATSEDYKPEVDRPRTERGLAQVPDVALQSGPQESARSQPETSAPQERPADRLGSARRWAPVPGRDLAGPERVASAAPRSSQGPRPAGALQRAATGEAAFVVDPTGAGPERRRAPTAEVGLRDRRPENSRPSAESSPVPAPRGDSVTSLLAELEPRGPGKPRERTGVLESPQRFNAGRFEVRTRERPEERALYTVEAPARDEPLPDRQLYDTPYRSRQGVEKTRALDLYGGSEETEAAVAAGLRYLADIQNRHGYWGSVRDRDDKYRHVVVGKTGLALLAFLGAGHTPGSGSEYSQVAEKAISFLLEIQDERSGHFGDSSSYGHAIATYALGECYAITREERLRRPIEFAVRQIVRNQETRDDARFRGGWGYYYPDDSSFDRWPRASITAWQVMALESARLGGIEVRNRVFDRAREFLENCWDRDRGAFRYSHDPSRLRSAYDILPGSTPASLFALSLLGTDVSGRKYRDAREFVSDRRPRGYRYEGDDAFVHRARGNLYFWYYGTLAFFRLGGERWERWNAAMKETLLPSQGQDGSWPAISIYASYAGDDDEDRSYSTAMNVLTLEVYYRYFTPLLKVK